MNIRASGSRKDAAPYTGVTTQDAAATVVIVPSRRNRRIVDPEADRHADEPIDLLEREQALPRQELDRLGHAVDAADVATVGDADPQVVVDPTKGVDQTAVVWGHGRHQWILSAWPVGLVGPVEIALVSGMNGKDGAQAIEKTKRIFWPALQLARGHGIKFAQRLEDEHALSPVQGALDQTRGYEVATTLTSIDRVDEYVDIEGDAQCSSVSPMGYRCISSRVNRLPPPCTRPRFII